MSTEKNAAQVADLRRLADWLEAHPTLTLSGNDRLYFVASTGEEAAEITRAMADGAAIGEVRKHTTLSGSYVAVEREFGPAVLSMLVARGEVCERVVVGTETVEIDDPEAPKITVERDVIRWDCNPLLAAVADAS